MNTISRICLWLAAFLGIAAVVYGFTSHERGGATLLLVAAATFCFLGLVSRELARHESEEEAGEEPPHVGPTIWPFGFAISGLFIALGLIIVSWLLIVGAIVFALAAVGWVRDVARSRVHTDHS